MLRPQYKGANDPWQPECLASERPARQSGSNNTSVGAPGCRTPSLQLNAQFTSCYRCYAIPPSSKKPLMHACVCCWRSPQRDNIPHYRPSAELLSQIAVRSTFGIRRRFVTSVFNHSTHHSIVHTACVMLSTDSFAAKATPRHGTSCNHSRHL